MSDTKLVGKIAVTPKLVGKVSSKTYIGVTMIMPSSYIRYKHPDAHSADMIIETENRKFITAAEKTILNGYVHDQIKAADTWTITHNLNKFPSVSCVDSAGNLIVGEVTYISVNQVILSFSSKFSGKAYLN